MVKKEQNKVEAKSSWRIARSMDPFIRGEALYPRAQAPRRNFKQTTDKRDKGIEGARI